MVAKKKTRKCGFAIGIHSRVSPLASSQVRSSINFICRRWHDYLPHLCSPPSSILMYLYTQLIFVYGKRSEKTKWTKTIRMTKPLIHSFSLKPMKPERNRHWKRNTLKTMNFVTSEPHQLHVCAYSYNFLFFTSGGPAQHSPRTFTVTAASDWYSPFPQQACVSTSGASGVCWPDGSQPDGWGTISDSDIHLLLPHHPARHNSIASVHQYDVKPGWSTLISGASSA